MQKNYQNIDYDDFDDCIAEFHNGNLLLGVYEFGFRKPSQIQSKTIEPIKDGRDLIAQAQSGSGKTGAFIIGAYTKIDVNKKYPQALIIANSRELAIQIKDVGEEIGKHINAKICLCIGGVDEDNTIENNLKTAQTSQLLVCTPGRLNGLVRMDNKLLDDLNILILDEADELLSDDFIEQIKSIWVHIRSKTQICLFSATSNSSCVQTIKNENGFMKNPVEIFIHTDKIKVDLIKNYVTEAGEYYKKFGVLLNLYKNINICQSVIFVNTINSAISLSKKLEKHGHSVGVLHGKLSGKERITILKNFRNTQTRVLIATDVIARGIDIEKIGLIINYDIPQGDGFQAQYIHRVGRSGRYGKLGVAINIMTDDCKEWNRLKSISQKYKIDFCEIPPLEKINLYLSGVNGYSYKEIENAN
ncbi:eukaryotic translation initiation factor eIF-4A [Bodo saltans virus]|uniref:Eukaryotic translation initiation factor eIF-4A n=1 Tax=Bodo saltans virus TaxID=2024608 RepID=A0A2H4UVC7_9VIRU|nr:eukaryotic translation initiation factor eIF-4A [Bodo saltans virus]ATZ80870.1 eukaryotic translation initiation factor eIF-4A [Bodo saltans virus]